MGNTAKPILIVRLPHDVPADVRDQILQSLPAAQINDYHVIVVPKGIEIEVLNGEFVPKEQVDAKVEEAIESYQMQNHQR